jgi:hypothetical protein
MSCHKIDGKKCKKVIESLLGKGEFMEVETNGCSGYKSPAECPHNGVFDPLSAACKECIEDATIGVIYDKEEQHG